jgi:hypothetical protein
MNENIDSIIGKQAFSEVDLLNAKMDGLVDRFEKSAKAGLLLQNALSRADGWKTVNDNINSQRQNLSELEKIKLKLISTEEKLQASLTLEGQMLKQLQMEQQKQTQATKEFINLKEAEEGSLVKLRVQLKQLSDQYAALGKVQRESVGGKEMLANLQSNYLAVQKLEQAMGQHGRNVGNYQGQLFGLTQVFREIPGFMYSAQTGILGLSNNLPILADNFKTVSEATNEATGKANGTSGAFKIFASSIFSFGNIFAIAIGLFTLFSKEIFEFLGLQSETKKAIDDIKTSTDALNKALDSTDVKNAVTNVQELTNEIKLAKEGFIDKTKVVHHYNDTIGKTTGLVLTLDEAEKALVKNGTAYIQMTLYKAAAQLALQESAAKSLEIEKQRQKQVQDFENHNVGTLDNLRLLNGAYEKEYEDYYKSLKTTEERFFAGKNKNQWIYEKMQEERTKGLKKESDDALEIANEFQRKASEVAKKMNFDFFGGGENEKVKKPKKPKKPKKEKTAIELLTDKYEIEKSIIETYQNDNVESEEVYQAKLYKVAEKYRALDAGNNADYQNKLSKDMKNASDKVAGITLDNFTKSQAAKQKEIETQKKNLDEKTKAQIAVLEELQKYNDEESAKEIIALNNQYAFGKISKEDYEKSKLAIVNKYNQMVLQSQLDYAQSLLLHDEIVGEARIAIIKKIAELQLKISEDGVKAEDENKAKQIKKLTEIESVQSQITGGINDIATLAFDTEMSRLDVKEKRLNEYYENEINLVNISGKTKEEREKEIARLQIIQARDKRKLEKERIDAARKQAIVQKALDIAGIITSTILAVTKAGLITPKGIATGIAGAIAVAKALATPLPQYKDGTANHPGGKAIVGDGGVSEWVEQPDGTMYATPSKPTIVDLPKGTKVFPKIPVDKFLNLINNSAMVNLSKNEKINSDNYAKAYVEAIEKNSDKLDKLIKVAGDNHANISINGNFEHYAKIKSIVGNG